MSVKPIRSPAYPSMSLSEAIAAVGKIEGLYRSSPVDRENGAKLIGYSSLSGPANKALAALASFGLVERAGKGMMKVTALARAILHAQSAQERTDALLQAAMQPKLFKDIRDRFPDVHIPPEDGVKTYLNREGFNASAVGPAAKAFLETMRFIEERGATESHGVASVQAAESDSPTEKFGGAAIGDLVQWESQGTLQFETPRRVRWVSADGAYVAVEGSNTGIPMDQVIVESRAARPPPPPLPDVPPEKAADVPVAAGLRKAVFPVSEGDVTFLFPASLSSEALQELEDYLEIFLKKERRRLSEQKPT